MPLSFRPSRRRLTAVSLTVAAVVAASVSVPAYAANPDPNPNSLERKNAQLSGSAATQGMVLLENHDHALPMRRSGNVAVFGVGAYKTVKGGTGSGNVNNRYTISVRKGLENAGYSITTSDAYWNAMTAAYDAKYGASEGSPFGSTIDYASVEQQLTASSVQPTAATDTALYVVARNSGEGADRSSGAGDYELTQTESDDIALIGRTYRRVVVVLNTGGIIDTAFFRTINAANHDPRGGQALDAMLLMSQAGQESGNAVTKVLNGRVTPSGKLTDTWASKYSYYPAAGTFADNDGDPLTEQYSEGVYVGYRYFDSFYKTIDAADPASVVDYPFGYGMSYADFAVRPLGVTANAHTVSVRARVLNTGTRWSGKQVVQVYFSAPQSGLDKPYQQLAGYAKTDTLAPGASQIVTIRYRTTDMASYDDDTASYVLDAGDYAIRVGDSSRDTHVAAKIRLDRQVTTQQLAHELNDQQPDHELTSDPADFYSYAGEAAELAAAPVVTLDAASIKTRHDASPYQQSVPVDSSSPYYAIDGDRIAKTTAYVNPRQTDFGGTGKPYAAKTGESVEKVRGKAGITLFDVAKGTATMKEFVAGLTPDQLADIVEGAARGGTVPQAVGAAGYTTSNYENLGIAGMTLSDGPAGLRLTPQVSTTPPTYQYATAWPIGTLLAQTWDRALVQRVGRAIGKEMREFGVTLWLAPGMNIHRDPLNGRNFEYYSEDPLIAGLTAAAANRGVQSNPGVGVTIKHFAANNQETDRTTTNAIIDERALREIYLRGFQIAVESAQPMALMSSYNKINGYYTAGEYDLLTNLLRGEWGYRGLVMSDWGGTSSGPVPAMYAGNDLIMPGQNPDEVSAALKDTPPTIDVTGLPVLNITTIPSFHYTTYGWKFGGLSLSADGATTISSTVDSSTDLSKVQSTVTTLDAQFHPTTEPRGPYDSVDDAYADVRSLLDSNALSDAQKAAITVTPTYATAGDSSTPVVAYTVTMRGDYPMRLGDVQRSATRVLTTVLHSAAFGELAEQQGIKGIHIGAYPARTGGLKSVVSDYLGPISGR